MMAAMLSFDAHLSSRVNHIVNPGHNVLCDGRLCLPTQVHQMHLTILFKNRSHHFYIYFHDVQFVPYCAGVLLMSHGLTPSPRKNITTPSCSVMVHYCKLGSHIYEQHTQGSWVPSVNKWFIRTCPCSITHTTIVALHTCMISGRKNHFVYWLTLVFPWHCDIPEWNYMCHYSFSQCAYIPNLYFISLSDAR